MAWYFAKSFFVLRKKIHINYYCHIHFFIFLGFNELRARAIRGIGGLGNDFFPHGKGSLSNAKGRNPQQEKKKKTKGLSSYGIIFLMETKYKITAH